MAKFHFMLQELDTDKILQQLKYIQMVCYRLFFMVYIVIPLQ